MQKNFTFLRRFDRKNTVSYNIKKSNRQACFQMTLNARKSSAGSCLKIKTNDFREIHKNSETFDSEPRNSSLWICERNIEILPA